LWKNKIFSQYKVISKLQEFYYIAALIVHEQFACCGCNFKPNLPEKVSSSAVLLGGFIANVATQKMQ
jgi:hypothetical protein